MQKPTHILTQRLTKEAAVHFLSFDESPSTSRQKLAQVTLIDS